MITFRAPRREGEVRLRLPNPTTPAALAAVLADVRARPGVRFALDCAGVTALPDRAVDDLARLRAEGADLVFVNCGVGLRQVLARSGLPALAGELAARHGAHPTRGPHPAFFRARGA